MDFSFSQEQEMLRQTLSRLLKEQIEPMIPEVERTDRFPVEAYDLMKQYGITSVLVPEEYGGMGGNITSFCIVMQEIGKVFAGLGGNFGGHNGCIELIEEAGSDQLKEEYLGKVAKEGYLAAITLTEPNAGSDAASIKTRAVLDGDHYILNGTKCFISNGGLADFYCVFAVTDPAKRAGGISLFVVDKDVKGLSQGKKEDKMGMKGAHVAEVIFEDVKVPKEKLVGAEGKAFYLVMTVFNGTRCAVGALATGIAQGAIAHALKYAQERVSFGKPIYQHQALQFMIADMAMKTEAAEALVYKAASIYDSKQGSPAETARLASMAKCFGSDVAMSVTSDAVQVFGGYGYMKDYPVERYMRDAKLTQIFDGTNQIHRMVIARNLV